MEADESDAPLMDDTEEERSTSGGGTPQRDWSLFNIIILGFSFMFLFSAFQTCSMVETIVLEGAVQESNGTFQGKGYTSLAIVYGVFAPSNWVAPSVVAILGAKWSMILGGFLYCWYIALFLKPMVVTLYLTSALVGFGAAILWTAQGNFLTINSTHETMSRNTGIFWALLQFSLLFGNLFFYLLFNDQTTITSARRTILFIVLTSVSVIGVLLMLLMRKVPQRQHNEAASGRREPAGALEALKRSVQMFFTKEMLLLCVCFAYTGLEQSFWAGIYGTSIGHTEHYGSSAKELTGLSGVFIGVGEIFGGAVFGLLGNHPAISKRGRDSVVFFGYLVHSVCFYLIYLNSPNESPLMDTSEMPFIKPNKYLAMFCAFLLGLGDSSYNTQIYPILGALYPNDSASACAIYKFIQALASAVAFVYGRYFLLQWHLLIMMAFATIGTMFFFIVDRFAREVKHVISDTEIQYNP